MEWSLCPAGVLLRPEHAHLGLPPGYVIRCGLIEHPPERKHYALQPLPPTPGQPPRVVVVEWDEVDTETAIPDLPPEDLRG